ncbi:L-2-hydroxyglutarate oxidase [Algoriphagus aestuariicola]|uniref:L-2-hydroxyglutarate oxidase n=1 Tax=Algoriphagus aestuariicola TaxID=1852016 RepID=A0ABS3BVR7_9BACT|nr:L-2-hydroxyglutarate oxidase [Algoriphagus aestuariicola]MBN7803213.1 L-2-hydroxyglutarate oxidase [Algoriphagus aestuariicola]
MKYDIIVIGGGIVGLATSLKLKEKNPDLKIAILEKEDVVAKHQTGNNSGVIHAGVYYKPGSQKAINCTTGYRMLLDFCNKEDVPYELCGKLIVATQDEELPRLETLYQRAIQNGLDRVTKIKAEEIQEYEPHAVGKSALLVPYTGIIDYKAVSEKYASIFKKRYGGEIITGAKVTNIRKSGTKFYIETLKSTYVSNFVVNTAGLYSDKVAELSGSSLDTRIIPFRGEYTELKKDKRYLVKNLIYPVPDPNFPFLGVHFTRMINGGIEAGPNAVWAFKREGYKKTSFDLKEFFESLAWPGFRQVMAKYWKVGLGEYHRSFSKSALTKALQRLIPEITQDDLEPGGAGVRAQACHRSEGLLDDFCIMEGDRTFNVLNAPSPAATSSLSIGETLSTKILSQMSYA